MRVKTYRGASTKAVLARIKAELGPEAVILGTRTFDEEGVCVAEVTAALEDPAPSKASLPAEGSPSSQPAPEAWGQWHKEWSRIKEHLTVLLRPQLDLGRLAPIQRQALEYLEREGLEGDVVVELFTRLNGNPRGTILQPLEEMVRVRPWARTDWPQRFHAVAGPAGVGKTQALLRMALERRHEDPDARICLVNADTRRMKSKLVLQHYAQLAGMEYRELSEPLDAAQLVADARNFDLCCIDLPALERGRTLDGLLQELGLEAMAGLCVHLVLTPQYAMAQLRALCEQYDAPRAASLVWTKLDESYSFGAMVNTAWATGLPCSVLSYGTGLSNSMCAAGHLTLWRLLFKHTLPGGER